VITDENKFQARNRYRAYFTLVGEFDPTEITSRLGLAPTESWKKGERNPRTHFERNHSRWILDSRLEESASLDAHIRDVLQQLKPYVEIVRELRLTLNGWMQTVGHFHDGYPGVSLDEDIVAGLAEIKVGVDFDFYYLYSDKREDSN